MTARANIDFAPIVRGLCIAWLVGIGFMALHVVDAKVDQASFYESSTGWHGHCNPLLVLPAAIGLVISLLASVAITNSASKTFEPGIRWYMLALRFMCFPATLVLLFTLTNCPNWFAQAVSATALPGALILFVRHKRVAARAKAGG